MPRAGTNTSNASRHTPFRQTGMPFRGRPRATTIGALVPKLTKQVFQRHGFATASLITDWPTVIGPDLAAKCQPVKLKWPRTGQAQSVAVGDTERPGGTLQLAVEPAFALEIQHRLGLIQDRINCHYGYRAVDRIRIIQIAGAGTPQDRGSGQPGSGRQPFGSNNAPQRNMPTAQATVSAKTATSPPSETVGDPIAEALAKLSRSIEADRAKRRERSAGTA